MAIGQIHFFAKFIIFSKFNKDAGILRYIRIAIITRMEYIYIVFQSTLKITVF